MLECINAWHALVCFLSSDSVKITSRPPEKGNYSFAMEVQDLFLTGVNRPKRDIVKIPDFNLFGQYLRGLR